MSIKVCLIAPSKEARVLFLDLLVDLVNKQIQKNFDLFFEFPLTRLGQIQLIDLLGKNFGNLSFPFINTEQTIFDVIEFSIIDLVRSGWKLN